MNYIYDILLNFDSKVYDHYEWNLNDNIYHIKKIPLFKVKENMINDVINYNIMINQDFLGKIRNKTEIYLNRSAKQIEYACILCCNEKVIALKLDNKGKIIKYSKMLISEELETIENQEIMPYTSIEYVKGKEKNKLELKTKEEIKKTEFLKTKLKNSSKEQLEYLYYELYNKKPNNIEIKDKLELELETWNEKTNKMYEFYNLIKTVK